jgi:DNA recombination protein RmuC
MTIQELISAIVGLIAGFLAGFLIRNTSAKQERESAQAQKAQQDDLTQKVERELAGVRAQLGQSQADSAAKAGFESLAGERLTALAERNTQVDLASRQLEEKDREILKLSRLNSQFETDLANERGNGERLTQQFKVLANEILRENSKVFSEQNKESLSHLLNPLTRDLNEFRVKVEEVKAESLVGRTELSAQLKGLESLNRQLSDEAHNLATALRRDTKAQGNWGETILLNILENSGFLQKGIHFSFQQSFLEEAEEGETARRRQTDVVVKLPGGRHLIIDSKVSINAYNDFLKAGNEEERKNALKNHLASVRRHYDELAGRNYHRLSGVQSPDFVVMFVPIEPAFMLAMQEDDGLWLDAYKKGVLLAGPTTVLFVVRIVENLWRQEQQAQNVQRVMDRGEKLHDKFVGFVEDLETVGNRISEADQSYREAFSKLTSGRENLVRQVEMLRELGLKPKKKLKPKLLEAAGIDENLPLLAAGVDTEEGETS